MATDLRKSVHKERLEDMLVVDCDVHLNESPGDLAPYCDLPWQIALDHIKNVSPDRHLDVPGFSPGESLGGYQAIFPTSHEKSREVKTREQMRTELSKIKVDIGILFPDLLLKLPVLTQSEYAAAIARAYNAWMVDKWASVELGLLGCIVACPQKPEDTANEIRKYAKDPRVVGVYFPCAGLDPLWGHRMYDPIYQAAEAADLPVLLHSSTCTHPVFPFNNHGFDNEIPRHVISHTFALMSNVMSMITTGVPVRFPNLRICTVEGGVAWVPFLKNRLDKEYIEKRREVPFLEQRPSYYLKHMWNGTQPIEEPENPEELKLLMQISGEDTIVFASDWPHHDFDHPLKVHQLPLSNEVMRKILGENALRLFKIDAQGHRLNL